MILAFICLLSALMSFMQIAKVLGARVVAVVRGQAKVTALRDLGADVVINSAAHKDEPLRKLIKVGFKPGASPGRSVSTARHNAPALHSTKQQIPMLPVSISHGGAVAVVWASELSSWESCRPRLHRALTCFSILLEGPHSLRR